MRTGVGGAVVIVAVALAACGEQPPAKVDRSAPAVAERPGTAAPAQQPAQQPATAVAESPATLTSGSWVARAGEVVVTEPEFLAYAKLVTTKGLEGRSLEERRALAERLLVRKAAAADAEKRGFGSDPLLEKADMTWRMETYPPLYWAATVEKEARVSDQELRALLKPQAQYRISAIVLGDDAEAESLVKDLHARLRAGADFEKAAAEQSMGFLAEKGGDMGWVTLPNFMIEEKEAALVARTKPGGITEPVLTRLGWTIFKVRERREADQIFAAMKRERLPELLQQRIEEDKAKRMQELRQRASIHYPAKMPNAPKNAPAAVVNGYVFPADPREWAGEEHGGVPRLVRSADAQLERTIDNLLLMQEAERIGIAARPELVQMRAVRRIDLLAQLQFRSGTQPVLVSDKELHEEYQRYYTPDTYEFQAISTTSRERAAEALRRARAGESFDALAAEYNTGNLARAKGKIPLGSPSMHPASIQAALPTLKDGEVSELLDLGGGNWGVVKRTSQQFFVPPPFEQVQDKIRKRLELQKRSSQTMALAEEYGKKLRITYNESLLAKL